MVRFDVRKSRLLICFHRHSGVIVQCQPRKYLVQVDQQQYWIESDLIRPDQVDSIGF